MLLSVAILEDDPPENNEIFVEIFPVELHT